MGPYFGPVDDITDWRANYPSNDYISWFLASDHEFENKISVYGPASWHIDIYKYFTCAMPSRQSE